MVEVASGLAAAGLAVSLTSNLNSRALNPASQIVPSNFADIVAANDPPGISIEPEPEAYETMRRQILEALVSFIGC